MVIYVRVLEFQFVLSIYMCLKRVVCESKTMMMSIGAVTG